MKYVVHLYPTVRVKVTDIEANSVEEAIAKAEKSVDLNAVLNIEKTGFKNVECVQWDEGVNNYLLVDPLNEAGDVIHSDSQWLDGNGAPLVDGMTQTELKARNASAAGEFMREFFDYIEGDVATFAEKVGVRTITDLFCLHASIVGGETIEFDRGNTSIIDVLERLSSSERWMQYIKSTYQHRDDAPRASS